MLNRRLQQLTLRRRAEANDGVVDKTELYEEEEVAKEKLRVWLKKNNVSFHPQLGLAKLQTLKKKTQDSNK